MNYFANDRRLHSACPSGWGRHAGAERRHLRIGQKAHRNKYERGDRNVASFAKNEIRRPDHGIADKNIGGPGIEDLLKIKHLSRQSVDQPVAVASSLDQQMLRLVENIRGAINNFFEPLFVDVVKLETFKSLLANGAFAARSRIKADFVSTACQGLGN